MLLGLWACAPCDQRRDPPGSVYATAIATATMVLLSLSLLNATAPRTHWQGRTEDRGSGVARQYEPDKKTDTDRCSGPQWSSYTSNKIVSVDAAALYDMTWKQPCPSDEPSVATHGLSDPSSIINQAERKHVDPVSSNAAPNLNSLV